MEQGVEQGRFAGIGLPDDGYRYTAFQGIAQPEGIGQPGDGLRYFLGQRLELATVGKLQVFVVGEIQLQFEQRDHVEQFFAQAFQVVGKAAAHLLHGHPVHRCRGGGNQVGYGFGLAQVHFAMHEGTLGKFAGPGQPATLGDEQLQHFLQDIVAPVAADFGAILARVGMGCPENRDQHLVDDVISLDNLSEGQGVGFLICEFVPGLFGRGIGRCIVTGRCVVSGRPEDGLGGRQGLGTADTDHPQRSTGSGGHGADGVCGQRMGERGVGSCFHLWL